MLIIKFIRQQIELSELPPSLGQYSSNYNYHRHGAEVVEDQGKPSRGQNFGAFGGGGFKLGDSSSASEPIPSGKILMPLYNFCP